MPRANRKSFLLVHSQTMDVESCFTVPRHSYLTSFAITISKSWTHTKLKRGSGFGNEKQSMYFVFVTKTKQKPISRDNFKNIVTKRETPK